MSNNLGGGWNMADHGVGGYDPQEYMNLNYNIGGGGIPYT